MSVEVIEIVDSPEGAVPKLRYSIVSSDEEENPLKVKLKVSEKQKIDNVPRTSTRRKTINKIYKDDYEVDIVSPMRNVKICRTPTKRNSEETSNDTPIKKQTVVVCTPKSNTATKKASTPQKSGRRSVRTPLKFEDEPKKTLRVNLDESFRRSVLRCRLNLEDIRRTPSSEKRMNNLRTLRSKSNSRQFYYESDESEEEKKELPTRKSARLNPENNEKNRGNKRILRSRSVSTTSVESSEDNLSLTPRKRKVSSPKSVVKTPRNRAKLIREGIITPSMQERSKKIGKEGTPLMKARSQLHVSFVPDSLPCREKEYRDIYGFLEGKLLEESGGCMYISGVPGTGKTATVTSVISNLQKSKNIPKFDFVNVNGMRLTEPRQAYVEISKQLIGKSAPWEQAQNMLEERFTNNKKKSSKPVVMLIDELDILCTKRQDVVYNLLDWPNRAVRSQLVVIAIANTMDLPERLLARKVASRLGLTRLPFAPYTFKQLQEIVERRLAGIGGFDPDAIQLVARKVASVSGDARRALDICRRAAEIAEKSQLVNISHVNEALNAMITQPKVTAIKRCSKLEQLLLRSIVAEVERTGVEETTFSDCFKMLVSCCALEGFKMVSTTVAMATLSRLSASRLILTDQKCSDIYRRVILNVSADDVYFALKKD